MLGQVAGEIDQFGGDLQRQAQARVVAPQARSVDVVVLDLGAIGAPHRVGHDGGDVLGQAQRLADVADRRTGAIVDDRGADRRPMPAVTRIDILHHLLAPLVLEVDVDVRRLLALVGDEPLDQQILLDGIDGGDAQAIANHRIGRRAAPLAQDVLLVARPGDDVVHGEEIGRVSQRLNQLQFLAQGRDDLDRNSAGIPRLRPAKGQVHQPALRRPAGRHRLVGIFVFQVVQIEPAGLDDLGRAGHRVLVSLEQAPHLGGGLEEAFGVVAEKAGAAFESAKPAVEGAASTVKNKAEELFKRDLDGDGKIGDMKVSDVEEPTATGWRSATNAADEANNSGVSKQ